MKKSAKNNLPPIAIPAGWNVLFSLQAARNEEELAQALISAIADTAQAPLRLTRLIYKTVACFERVTISGGRLSRESIDTFHFSESCHGFFRCSAGSRLFLTENDEYAQIQLELPAQTDVPVGHISEELVRFAFGQLRLLLRIRQQESNAIRDDLTSAYNQNYLKKFIDNEIARYRRAPAPFAVLFIDLDNLKSINERYCHLMGSRVLKEVADIFMRAVRKTDLVARFGGDEFVVVLLHTELSYAVEVCQRIREMLNAARLCRAEETEICITASYGITVMSPRSQTAEDLIREADQAMFKVKNGGKNAIEIFQGD